MIRRRARDNLDRVAQTVRLENDSATPEINFNIRKLHKFIWKISTKLKETLGNGGEEESGGSRTAERNKMNQSRHSSLRH